MNKITYFIISFFISILTVIATLFTNPDNFYGWLIFVIIILFCPLVLYKLCKTTQVSKEQKSFLSQFVIFGVVLLFAWQHIFPPNNDYIVAISQSRTKANEIQEFLTTQTTRPVLEIIPKEKNHPKLYAVSVKHSGSQKNHKLSHRLLNSNLFDDSVIINPNIKYTRNRIKILKQLKKECEKILYGIEDIRWLEIKIVPPENINDDNAKIKSITVRYETKDNADSQKIKKQITNFINSLLKDSTIEIVIEDLESNHKAYQFIVKAQDEFEKKNYSKALEFINEAIKLNNNYIKDTETIPKIIELERKIKNTPNNYQYYIEMGDLLSSDIFTTSLYANTEAIKNYEKALELNPKAYEVYEKIARNYTYLSMKYSIIEDFSTNTKLKKLEQECNEKSVEYSLKAIEDSQGNDRIYQSLAYHYYSKKDYDKALEYYNKIKTTDLPCKACIGNKKFCANLKTGHYIDAWRATKDCSLWFCKLVRLNFIPSEI